MTYKNYTVLAFDKRGRIIGSARAIHLVQSKLEARRLRDTLHPNRIIISWTDPDGSRHKAKWLTPKEGGEE